MDTSKSESKIKKQEFSEHQIKEGSNERDMLKERQLEFEKKTVKFQEELYNHMNNSGRWFVDALLDELHDKGLSIHKTQPYNINNYEDLLVLLSWLDDLIYDDSINTTNDFISSFSMICNSGAIYATKMFTGMITNELMDFYDFSELASKLNKRARSMCGSELLNIANLYETTKLDDSEFCYYVAKYYVAIFWWLYFLSRVDINACEENKKYFYNR